MADLANDIRLAVDSGKAVFGVKESIDSMMASRAKAVIVASSNKRDRINDIMHLAKLSEVKVIVFQGNPMNLGVVCGKPYSVSVLSIMEPGSSNILKENY
ncbi:MAG: 50S ribosomal protein L30e [Candidatus Micrarchaeota archaeon]|nr:50S ribosomal protein L30e [Candidatus Micrarchaeota archaeon]